MDINSLIYLIGDSFWDIFTQDELIFAFLIKFLLKNFFSPKLIIIIALDSFIIA